MGVMRLTSPNPQCGNAIGQSSEYWASLVQGLRAGCLICGLLSPNERCARPRRARLVRSANERTYIEQYGNARMPVRG